MIRRTCQVIEPARHAPIAEWIHNHPMPTANLTVYEAAQMSHLKTAYIIFPDRNPDQLLSLNFEEAYRNIKEELFMNHRVAVVINYH